MTSKKLIATLFIIYILLFSALPIISSDVSATTPSGSIAFQYPYYAVGQTAYITFSYSGGTACPTETGFGGGITIPQYATAFIAKQAYGYSFSLLNTFYTTSMPSSQTQFTVEYPVQYEVWLYIYNGADWYVYSSTSMISNTPTTPTGSVSFAQPAYYVGDTFSASYSYSNALPNPATNTLQSVIAGTSIPVGTTATGILYRPDGGWTMAFTQTSGSLSSTYSTTAASAGTYTLKLYAWNGNSWTQVGTSSTSVSNPPAPPSPGTYSPTVETLTASSINPSNVTLNGNLISTGGLTTSVWFEWGNTPSYGNTTAQSSRGIGNFNQVLDGLTPNSTYYYHAVAQNSKGIVYGGIILFETTQVDYTVEIFADTVVYNTTIYLRPNAEGNFTQFNNRYPYSGDHWDKIDEQVLDSSDWIGHAYCASINTAYDTFNIDNISVDVHTIESIKIYYVAASNLGARLSAGVLINGIFYLDSYVTPPWGTTTTYTYILNTNPNTGQGWTVSDINNIQIAFKVDLFKVPDEEARIYQAYIEVVLSVFNESGTVGESFVLNREKGVDVDIYSFAERAASCNYTGNTTIKFNIADTVFSIYNVINLTSYLNAAPVTSYTSLENGTYFFNESENTVYIRTTDLNLGDFFNWVVVACLGVNFNINLPQYLESGEYIMASGAITDVNGNILTNFVTTTTIRFNGTDTDAIDPIRWNCDDGNFLLIVPTSRLIPGEYTITIEFTDDLGFTSVRQSTLYLGIDVPIDYIYTKTFLHFTFYDNKTGLGLPAGLFKIYVSDSSFISEDNRIYTDVYNTFIGQTLYYKIEDYFGNQIYPLNGSYSAVKILELEQYEDVGITWNSLSVKNMNSSIVLFQITNGSRTYSQFIFPYDSLSWNVMSGNYSINITYYDTTTDAITGYSNTNITISSDTYFWIKGYDLQDVIISVNNVNSSIIDQIVNVGVTINNDGVDIINQTINLAAYLENVNSSIQNQINNLEMIINNVESNLTGQINLIQQTIYNNHSNITMQLNAISTKIINTEGNITNQINSININLTNLNASITNQLNSVDIQIQNHDLNLTTQVNTIISEIQNSNITGIDTQVNLIWNAINNSNSSINTQFNGITTTLNYIHSDINNSFVVTRSDINYINSTILNNISEMNATLFAQMVGILDNVSEAGISVFDKVVETLTNLLYTNSSIIYALSQSGSELNNLFSWLNTLTTPDVIIKTSEKPHILVTSQSDSGQILNYIEICPAFITKIKTINESEASDYLSEAKILTSSTQNGTISLLSDTLYIDGNSNTSLIIRNVSTGTEIYNKSYLPSQLKLNGQNIILNASSNISIKREIVFLKTVMFNWTYYPSSGLYVASLTLTNDKLNTTYYDVDWFVETANNTIPDFNTVSIYDSLNAIFLESDDWNNDGKFITFTIDSMGPSISRAFTFRYYSTAASPSYTERTVFIEDYAPASYNGKSYDSFRIQFSNDEIQPLYCSLYAVFNFSLVSDITSMIIFDSTNNVVLDQSDYIYNNQYVRIFASGIGTIPASSGRTYDVYFTVSDTPNQVKPSFSFTDPLFYISGYGISALTILFFASALLFVESLYNKKVDFVFITVLAVTVIACMLSM